MPHTEDADLRPNFLTMNRESSSPTLVVSGKVFTDPVDIVKFLCRCSLKPRGRKFESTDFIRLLYCPDLNPNFAAISSVSQVSRPNLQRLLSSSSAMNEIYRVVSKERRLYIYAIVRWLLFVRPSFLRLFL